MAPGTFRVSVDLDLCQGHGVCAEEAPEQFSINKQQNKVVLESEIASSELRQKIALAVQHCPTRALKIEDS
ncbi:MAG: ferredoxin [Myxococcota bacterium]|nr:ferredoxin [Myxococcota bacterium]